MHTSAGRLGRCGLALLLIAGLTGCGGGGGSGGDAATRTASLDLPAQPDPGVRARIMAMKGATVVPNLAVEQAIKVCMLAKGFNYVPSSPDLFEPKPIPRYFGLSSEEAETRGYASLVPAKTSAPDPNNAGSKGLSPARAKAFDLALMGDPAGDIVRVEDPLNGAAIGTPASGCLSEGRKRIFGDLKTSVLTENFSANFTNTALFKASHDPRAVELDRQWSACMTKAGFPDLERPGHAIEKAVEQVDQGQAESLTSGWPKRLAVADARCQTSTSFPVKRTHLEDLYLTAMARQFEARFTAAQDVYRQAAARARGIAATP